MSPRRFLLAMILQAIFSIGGIIYLFVTNNESKLMVSAMLVIVFVVDAIVLRRMVR